MLGLGRERVITVPVDSQGRMRADALPELTSPAIVCTQAGNVNTGAFDPAGRDYGPALQAGGWVHVDGAFGLWAAARRSVHTSLAAALERADSWATDAHKWLNVPYDSGLVFVRDRRPFAWLPSERAPTCPTSKAARARPAHPRISRRARGVEVWAALLSLGRTGLADLIERTCRTRRFAAGLARRGTRF